MLFKLMAGQTIEKHEIPVRITSNHWPVFKLGHHQIRCKDVKNPTDSSGLRRYAVSTDKMLLAF